MKYSDIEIPSWCNEPEPTLGLMGCWSLVGGYVEDHSHCTNCEAFAPIVTNEKEVILNNRKLRITLGKSK